MEPEGIALSLFRWLYRRRQPMAPEPRKPRLKWFPRDRVAVEPCAAIRAGGEPALTERPGALGFEIDQWTREQVVFKRGKKWGDLSVELVRLRVIVPTPVESMTWFQLEVDDVCLFDTGDLWVLSAELRRAIGANGATASPEANGMPEVGPA